MGRASDIRAAAEQPVVDVFAADLSSQAEARRLASEVLHRYPRLDVLVNNVGGFWATRHVTADGLERTFAVNHLAPFLLTALLRDRLEHSAPARVVTVSSGAQAMGAIDFDDLQGERNYSGQRAYNQSSWPTSCSPMNWPVASKAPVSPPRCCTPAWYAPRSAPKIRLRSSRSSPHWPGRS